MQVESWRCKKEKVTFSYDILKIYQSKSNENPEKNVSKLPNSKASFEVGVAKKSSALISLTGPVKISFC